MDKIKKERQNFDKRGCVLGSGILKFDGVGDRDVYNCSIPFDYNGEEYIFGRVEKRDEWAKSVTYLFKKTQQKDRYEKVSDVDAFPIEDPNIAIINGEVILGGVHVMYEKSKVKTYYNYFYRGKSPFSLKYFTTGPEYMKDIRLVELKNGSIGVFSRPRDSKIKEVYGTEAQIGYTEIDSLDDLDSKIIEEAPYIDNIFDKNEWGGCNQAICLDDENIGIIGHHSYNDFFNNGQDYPVYVNSSYLFNRKERKVIEKKIIGTRSSYPTTDAKLNALIDCAFTSGIIPFKEDKVKLYSGLNDCAEGYIIIDNPYPQNK